MPKLRLDQNLLAKLAKKTGKPNQYLREQISKKAGKLGISSAAAQVILAKQRGIGVVRALNRLPSDVRQEVRGDHQTAPPHPRPVDRVPGRQRATGQRMPAKAVDSLLQDATLRGRCKALLQGNKHFDRAFREATTVLEHRLKSKTGIKRMKPVDLVGKVLNPDPQRALLEVSRDKNEQDGFHAVCKGTMQFFRSRVHHGLVEEVTREDALKFCAFVDMLLGIIEEAEFHADRVQAGPSAPH